MRVRFNLTVIALAVTMILGAEIREAASQQGRIEFIKALLRERLEEAGVFDQWRREFQEMNAFMVMATPEATIVTIVESYVRLKASGRGEGEIFRWIEQQRSPIGSGPLPVPLTLQSYIRYRVDLEHGHTTLPLTDDFIAGAIRKSFRYFSTTR